MAEKKKRSRPNARVRRERETKSRNGAKLAEAAALRDQNQAKPAPLGAGGIELLGSDPAHAKEDAALVKRAAVRRWMPREYAAEAVPDKMLDMALNYPDGEVQVRAAEACIKLVDANVRMEELEIKRQELKLKRRRLALDRLKAQQNGINIQVTNQVANVTNPALTDEQRKQRLDEIRTEIRKSIPGEGDNQADREPGAAVEPAEDVAPAADDLGGDAIGPLAGRCAPLLLEQDNT